MFKEGAKNKKPKTKELDRKSTQKLVGEQTEVEVTVPDKEPEEVPVAEEPAKSPPSPPVKKGSKPLSKTEKAGSKGMSKKATAGKDETDASSARLKRGDSARSRRGGIAASSTMKKGGGK